MGRKDYAYINSNMLVWAREQTPFKSIDEVSEYSKYFSSNEILSWEQGRELPSMTEAKKLAQLYEIPFAALFLSEIPVKKAQKYIDRRTLFSEPIVKESIKLWKEIRYFTYMRNIALEYSSKIIEAKFQDMSSIENVEMIALKIRDFFKVTTPFKNASEYGGDSFRYFRSKVEEKDILVFLMNDVPVSEARGISLSYDTYPIIGINKDDSDKAKTFTLFHELAHLFRRTSSLCNVNFDEDSDKEEKICDSIAAEVLVPTADFKEYTNKKMLQSTFNLDYYILKEAKRYGVSKLVILRKLRNVELINYQVYEEMYDMYYKEFIDYSATQKAIQKSKKDNPIMIPGYTLYVSKNGKLIPSMILDAYGSGRISIGEVSVITKLKTASINKLAEVVLGK